jgi:hypothetical protein
MGKRLHCLPQLAQVGYQANRRFLDVQRISHDPADGQAVLEALTKPVITTTGTRIAGLRPLDPRCQALLKALCGFNLLPLVSPTAIYAPVSPPCWTSRRSAGK